MGWLRARRPAQKEERRAALLAAATRLFEERGLEKTSLSALACAAGITKASVYRYFGSKEEIYLAIVAQDMDEWITAVEGRLAALQTPSEGVEGVEGSAFDVADAVAHTLVEVILERPRFAALSASLASVLERNVSTEAAVEFKMTAKGYGLRFGNALLAALPELTLDQVRAFMVFLHVQVSGLWPLANPAEAVARALENPELAEMKIDFERELTTFLRCHLRGLLAR